MAGFELRPVSGHLPTPLHGAHIDLHLPNGLVRQYSLVNAPGETGSYTIGVKREADSAGGSACLHDDVREGDVLAASVPRNSFPLRRDAEQTLLLAGGVGLTPLLSMAQTLAHMGQQFALHVFLREAGQLAFADRLAPLGDRVTLHTGLGPRATRAQMKQIIAPAPGRRQLYICGPGPMTETALDLAESLGWPEGNVHFEYFRNTRQIDQSSGFQVALARSAMTLQVPPGRSILEVLRENGVPVPSSCEQGACGSCLATVIEGVVEHQDVFLSRAERARGDKIVTCVSRARSNRLVLDI